MNPRLPILTLAVAGAALFAACAGGGTSSAPGASSALPNAGSSGGAQPASGVRVVLSFRRNTASSANAAVRHGHASARRPAFIDPEFVGGVQLTVTSGSASQTVDYTIGYNTPACTSYEYAVDCTLNVPTLGANETISAIELDQAPSNASQTTGIGTAFPSNSAVLARGSANVTPAPGGYTNVALSLDPVVGGWYDYAFIDGGTANIGDDGDNRIVVTSNVASTDVLDVIPTDFDGFPTFEGYLNGAFVAQPFVDVNGSPAAVTATSSSSHFTVYAIPAATPTPAPPYATAASASFPNSGYLSNEFLGVQLAVHYDGAATTGGTLTFANNLTATPPPFSGAPSPRPSGAPTPPASSYASTFQYQYDILAASPSTVTLAPNGTQTITVSDPGGYLVDVAGACISTADHSAQLGTITQLGGFANGAQTFTLTAGSTAGTCTFQLEDDDTGVRTNTVTLTIT
jgi:hypothetical protein